METSQNALAYVTVCVTGAHRPHVCYPSQALHMISIQLPTGESGKSRSRVRTIQFTQVSEKPTFSFVCSGASMTVYTQKVVCTGIKSHLERQFPGTNSYSVSLCVRCGGSEGNQKQRKRKRMELCRFRGMCSKANYMIDPWLMYQTLYPLHRFQTVFTGGRRYRRHVL
jgi:hypothetical protein